MKNWIAATARCLGGLALTAVLGGLVTASMVRNSPGFDADERQLDTRLSAESRAAIAAEQAGGRRIVRFYARYMAGMLRGDLGTSPSLQRPIGELIRSRLPVTGEVMALGVAGGWALAFALALPAVMSRSHWWSRLAGVLSTCVLCVPSAAIAILIFAWGGPVHAIVALVLFPRVFEYLRNLLRDAYAKPHILSAQARGLRPSRILWRHVIPVCVPELLALAGISLAMAFGASIPVETFCDLPGIGQLAWKAAMARDLPVLITLTMLIAILTQLCNAVADWATAGMRGHAA